MMETRKFKLLNMIVSACFILLGMWLLPSPTQGAAVSSVSVWLDGKPLPMLVPPVVINERTMVSVRSVGEAVGGDVDWDGIHNRVTVSRGAETVILVVGQLTAVVNSQTQSMEVPARIVGERVMVPLRFIVEALGGGIDWDPKTSTANLLRATVKGIAFHGDGRLPSVTISAVGQLDATTFPLQNPRRIVVDLPSAGLAPGVPLAQDVQSPYITKIRTAASRDPLRVRIVLDLAADVDYNMTRTELGYTIGLVSRIQSVQAEPVAGKTRLTFMGNLPLESKVSLINGQRTLRIEVPQSRTSLHSGSLKVGSLSLNVAYSETADHSTTIIDVTPPYYIGHTIASQTGNSSIVLDLITSTVYGQRIWIDAGHGKIPGGKDDPGAIGRTYRTYEKNINLQVALELQKRLVAAGATVFMTRIGDEGVDFRDRPQRVNQSKPPIDLFVSVHHNSSTDPSARGTETYYWPTNPKSRLAAEAIHAAMVKGLGFPDRKVRQDSFYVLKYTLAPSVLVELGYLSNPVEERAIAEPGLSLKTYPGKAAEAIRNGILEYFRQENRKTFAN